MSEDDAIRRAVAATLRRQLQQGNTRPLIDESHVNAVPEGGTLPLPAGALVTPLAQSTALARRVKLVPASAVGPTFLREMAGPLPEIPLIPTGGVTLETAPLFLDNGALAVGVGRWLTDAGDVDAVRNRARLLSDVIARSAGRGAG